MSYITSTYMYTLLCPTHVLHVLHNIHSCQVHCVMFITSVLNMCYTQSHATYSITSFNM